MRIAVGSDHRGYATAQALVQHLKSDGHEVTIHGDNGGSTCDYPDVAWLVAREVAEGRCDRGILMCGTGIGMCIAANKVRGVLAALAQDELSAQLSRTHNNANVLCLSADLIGVTLAKRVVDTFMRTAFEGGRHARRIEKIHRIESGDAPNGTAH
ncbi:MAG: ribose 5-phosphate isomerase B [Phycisphaerales bacterium]